MWPLAFFDVIYFRLVLKALNNGRFLWWMYRKNKMRTKAFSLTFLLSKFYPNSLNFAHAEKHNCSTKRCPLPANIRLDEDVLKMSFVFVFRRRLNQEKYIRLGHKPSIRLQDVFKKSCKSICKYCKDVFKTFSRGIIRLNCLPGSRICLGHTSEKFMVSFLKF